MDNIRNWSLSDFVNCSIRRINGCAEIMVEDNLRLLGFTAPAEWSDFEIAEAGYNYFKELLNHLDE